ncbi:MAG: hypothetical protein JWN14_546 [Chthonomonadales bacterium]|nr:hypothetical protein [Chthonomonadales bacterium]
MKIGFFITRNLLGLLFLVFGLNGFLHFLPMPMPTGLAGQYFTVLSASHYMVPVFLLQIVGGALLLANRYVPIALVLLGPVIVNILMYHALMAPQGLPLAVIVTALFLFVFYSVRQAFTGIFAAQVHPEETNAIAPIGKLA